jgi:uncharacterized membrane protein YoaK (UPF0700 family)
MAFIAGMVNVASFLIFFSFSSNVTGYFAIFAAEMTKGDYYQVLMVIGWIFLFFAGSFTSNFIVIHFRRRGQYTAHAVPVILEMGCLLMVGLYGQFAYQETLRETEALLAIMFFAMGLQNGLTAGISNFAVKTTHLTGATTDLGILLSMFTKEKFRNNTELVNKAKLIASTFFAFITGALTAGLIYPMLQFGIFYVVCILLTLVVLYDVIYVGLLRLVMTLRTRHLSPTPPSIPHRTTAQRRALTTPFVSGKDPAREKASAGQPSRCEETTVR